VTTINETLQTKVKSNGSAGGKATAVAPGPATVLGKEREIGSAGPALSTPVHVLPTVQPPTNSLTHEQIAQRAQSVWYAKGCPPHQDEQNWLEAETQLKAERGLR
jgi:hypothetical protein